MNNSDIIETFDRLAATWDLCTKKEDKIINLIFTNSNINSNKDILDVGCGTGILIEDYLNRNVNSITAVDISTEMIKIASNKYPDIHFVCADISLFNEGKLYDNIVLYNCFPHLKSKEETIKHLSSLLKPNGILTIAHSMSINKLIKLHQNVSNISDIMLPNDLNELMNKYFNKIKEIDNEEMYMILGVKNKC